MREHERRHPRRSDRDVHPRPARRRLAAELFSDGACRAEEPLEPADVDRYQIVMVPLVPRREGVRQQNLHGSAANLAVVGGSLSPSDHQMVAALNTQLPLGPG